MMLLTCTSIDLSAVKYVDYSEVTDCGSTIQKWVSCNFHDHFLCTQAVQI